MPFPKLLLPPLPTPIEFIMIKIAAKISKDLLDKVETNRVGCPSLFSFEVCCCPEFCFFVGLLGDLPFQKKIKIKIKIKINQQK